MNRLSDHVTLERRYTRSVSLERDLLVADSILGYVPTRKAVEVLERFLEATEKHHAARAWTLTGVYGTGKSAFAHFLSALCAPSKEKIKKNALEIVSQNSLFSKEIKKAIDQLPKEGFVRAVATSQAEPLTNTILKALERGLLLFWENRRGVKPKVLKDIHTLLYNFNSKKGKFPDSGAVVDCIREVSRVTGAGVLLILDELGKNLEYASQNLNHNDLYLLQQIAEMGTKKDAPVFLFGLLHQSFSDYAGSLNLSQKNEWGKIQGRFEDISFVESSEQVLRLVGHAIKQSDDPTFQKTAKKYSSIWAEEIEHNSEFHGITEEIVHRIFPLQPVAAISLPLLCYRYGQNDRSIFNFLTSSEPHSFVQFLKKTSLNSDSPETLKLHNLYDYFIESSGFNFSSRPQFNRWTEIQGIINDAKDLSPDQLKALKTIGVFNLISFSGSFRATKELVLMALVDRPNETAEKKNLETVLESLVEKKLVTWRKQLNEYRVWQGTDFDIEDAITRQVETIRQPLASLLNSFAPLNPSIAQRHSYRTGTLRYFERRFVDEVKEVTEAKCKSHDSDGLIVYWVGGRLDDNLIPKTTLDGYPFVLVENDDVESLRTACIEYVALRNIELTASELKVDGVARREVRQRLGLAKKILDDTVFNSFESGNDHTICFLNKKKVEVDLRREFNSKLSDLCDKFYDSSLELWNELINRRELSSQAATARRVLIGAMIKDESKEQLGIEGYGPERSMYESLLRKNKIHRKTENGWAIGEPSKTSGIYKVWKEIENFCLRAVEKPVSMEVLYEELSRPPFGVKNGVIPILWLSVLMTHSDDISIYYNGSFVPVLGPEHFELFTRDPSKFSVKYFKIAGVRAEYFKELEKILNESVSTQTQIRNSSVLGIVRPLMKFMKSLPNFTMNTTGLSKGAIALRKALQNATEPDRLLFVDIPFACGASPVISDGKAGQVDVKAIRTNLLKLLRELSSSYDRVLEQSRELLYKALGVRSEQEKLREDLRVRARYMVVQCIEPTLKRFLLAVTDEETPEKNWLEAVLMVVADKPAVSWTDEDVANFEVRLSEISRRFINLEAVCKEFAQMPGDGFNAWRVTFSKQDGKEVHQMIWCDREKLNSVDKVVTEIIESHKLSEDSQFQKAVLAKLFERTFEQNPKLSKPSKAQEEEKEAQNG
jgi:hypothetical protein